MKSYDSENLSEYDIKEKIDYKNILNILIKNKNVVAATSFLGFFVAVIFALTARPVWQGEFQIVLDDEKSLDSGDSISSMMINPYLRNQKKATEIEILKSPAVMMEIFNFVKNEKNKTDKSFQDIRFKSWKKKYLNVTLKKGTDILDLKYRDSDKDLILTVLNKISSTYQQYSGKNRARRIELGMNFLEDQIELYKQRSVESSYKAQEYGTQQGLSINTDNQFIDNINIDVEIIRMQAASEIKDIDQKLSAITSRGSIDQLIFTASRIPDLDFLIEEINFIDKKLNISIGKFKEEDKLIKNLLNERAIAIDLLRRKTIGYLEAKKEAEKIRLQSSIRPKGILTKYRRLFNQSIQDKKTLAQLEVKFTQLSLENARNKDPWELITKPTLLPKSVSPRRRRMATIGLLLGSSIGMIFSILKEKRLRTILSVFQIKTGLGYPLLYNLSKKNIKKWDQLIQYLAVKEKFTSNDSFLLIPIGKISINYTQLISDGLNNFLNTKTLLFKNNLNDLSQFSKIILIAEIGVSSFDELEDITKSLSIKNKIPSGLILITSSFD